MVSACAESFVSAPVLQLDERPGQTESPTLDSGGLNSCSAPCTVHSRSWAFARDLLHLGKTETNIWLICCFLFGIFKWQRIIAQWKKWQFYNLPVVRGGRAIQHCSTSLQLEDKLRSHFKLIGRILYMASDNISVIWLIPPCTKITLTNNPSWQMIVNYLSSSKSLAHPLVLLRTSIKAQGLYIMLSSLILDIKLWHC